MNNLMPRTTKYQLRWSPDSALAAGYRALDWWTEPGGNIDAGGGLLRRIRPLAAAREFLGLAAAAYCIDRVTPRDAGSWSRQLELVVPVSNPDLWGAGLGHLETALRFLSGDEWHVRVEAASARPNDQPDADPSVDSVCLFSGGLDSLTGAITLLGEQKRLCLVGHYEGGLTPGVQVALSQVLGAAYGTSAVQLRQLFLRPAPPRPNQVNSLSGARERSSRTRSLLFIAAGLAVASSNGSTTPLVIPENGFIGVNVPLTLSRTGSLSTRTTHPYFIATLGEFLKGIGIFNRLENPFRMMTKGELLVANAGNKQLQQLARQSISCAHPEAARWAKRPQGNCGYCFPCLIRRASMYKVGWDVPADYAFDVARDGRLMAGERGADLRAVRASLRAAFRASDVLRNGPIASTEILGFAGVHQRGREELALWLNAQDLQGVN